MAFKRVFSWIVGAPVAILLICFAVANRHWTSVSLDPINTANPWLAVSMPTFLIFFAGIFIGMIVGGSVVWMRQGKWRKQARMAHTPTETTANAASKGEGSPLVPALRQPN